MMPTWCRSWDHADIAALNPELAQVCQLAPALIPCPWLNSLDLACYLQAGKLNFDVTIVYCTQDSRSASRASLLLI